MRDKQKAKRDARMRALRWVQLTCAECGNSAVVNMKDVPEAVCQKCACHYATGFDNFATSPSERDVTRMLWDLATTMHTEED